MNWQKTTSIVSALVAVLALVGAAIPSILAYATVPDQVQRNTQTAKEHQEDLEDIKAVIIQLRIISENTDKNIEDIKDTLKELQNAR